MRTIDTATLKPLGSEGHGPWLMDDGRLLRISSGNRAIHTEAEARAMLETYCAAAAAAGAPAGHEVIAVGDGFGVVVDYVAGIGLGMHVGIGSYTPDEAGRAMGELLRDLHGAHMGAGRDWGATFRRWAADLSPLLPEDAGERLVALIAAIPQADCLLHGDFHVGNVVVSGGEPHLIDMESAGFGHPAFDLAIARSRTLGDAAREAKRLGIDTQTAEHIARSIWNGLIEGYFEGADARDLEELDRRFEALMHVERCCFAYGAGHPDPPDAESEERRIRVKRHTDRLALLLPRVSHLDF